MKPIPKALKALRGTLRPDREKKRKSRAKKARPGDISEPWSELSREEKEIWRFAVENAPIGVLAAVDKSVLASWVIAQAQYRQAHSHLRAINAVAIANGRLPNMHVAKSGEIYSHPLVAQAKEAGQAMLRAANALGFSPQSRPRVMAGMGDDAFAPFPFGADDDDEADALEQLLASRPPDLLPSRNGEIIGKKDEDK